MPSEAMGTGNGRPSTVLSAAMPADTGLARLCSASTIAAMTPTMIPAMIPNSQPATSASTTAPRMQYQGTETLLVTLTGLTIGVSVFAVGSHVNPTVAVKLGVAVQQKPEAVPLPVMLI